MSVPSTVDTLTLGMQQEIEPYDGVRLISITPDPISRSVATDDLQLLADALQKNAEQHFNDRDISVKLEIRHVLSAIKSGNGKTVLDVTDDVNPQP